MPFASSLLRALFVSSLIVGVLLCPLIASAQKYNFNSFGIREGLPQGFVYTLNQDSLGYLWIGTGEGLAQYNGVQFRVFTTQHGLADNFISASCIDNRGKLWLGHYQGGISVRTEQGFKIVVPGENSSRINAMIPGPEGSIVVATQHNGLIHISPNSEGDYEANYLSPDWLEEIRLYALKFDAEGNLLLGTNQGLYAARLNGSKLDFASRVPLLDNFQISSLELANTDHLLIATRKSGLFELNTTQSDSVLTPLGYDPELPQRINFVQKNNDGRVWIGAASGLYLCTLTDNGTLKVVSRYDRSNGLNAINVRAILPDREGNFWLGTFGGGLVKFHNDYFNLVAGNNSISSPNINFLMPDGDKRLLLATELGISQLQFQDNAISSENFQNLAIENIGTELSVTSFCRAPDGTLWVGSSDQGLFFYHEPTKRLISHDLGGQLSDININHLSIDASGHLWVATSSEGAYQYNFQSKEVVNYSTRNGLLHNNILNIYHDRFGNSWFITQGTGLAKLWQGEFSYYSRREGLSFLDFNCMHQDLSGNYWIGTNGGGVYRFDGRTFTNFTSENGLRSNYCYAIVESRDSLLWFVSRNGLTRYDSRSESFSDYSDFNQNFSLSFNSNAAVADGNGNLYFGTESGLVSFRPYNGEARQPIFCTITKLTVQDTVAFTVDTHQVLGYDKYRLKFDFEGISLNNPNSVQYQYRLKGYDKDWNLATNENFAYYTGIEEGSYSFEVRAALPGNGFVTPASVFNFTIETPFWKTIWFLIFCILSGIMLVFTTIRLRTIQLQREKRKLEGMVEDRTKEIQKQTEELEQFTYAVSHDLKNPVINISGLLEVLRELQPPETEESHELFGMLKDTSAHLSSNLQKLMDVIKAKKTDIDSKEEVAFETVFKELNSNIYTLISTAEAKLVTNFEVPTLYFSHEHLYGFLYNLVTNAIKYSDPERKPEITVRSFRKGKFTGMSVADNGLGIDLGRDREKLFGMFKRIHDHTEGSGVGLHLIKAVIEKAGGSLEVESELGKGSTFTVLLPTEH